MIDITNVDVNFLTPFFFFNSMFSYIFESSRKTSRNRVGFFLQIGACCISRMYPQLLAQNPMILPFRPFGWKKWAWDRISNQKVWGLYHIKIWPTRILCSPWSYKHKTPRIMVTSLYSYLRPDLNYPATALSNVKCHKTHHDPWTCFLLIPYSAMGSSIQQG